MLRILLGVYKAALATQIAAKHNSKLLISSVTLIIICICFAFRVN